MGFAVEYRNGTPRIEVTAIMEHVIVYTDGACSKNGSKTAQASWGVWIPSHPDWSASGRVDGTIQTNNRGELSAILEAFRILHSKHGAGCSQVDVTIFTDSEYAKHCLTKWVPGWIRKKWTTTSGTPVLNRDLIEATLALQPKFNSITYEYVRAHTGGSDEHSKHNDRVDRMARRVLDASVSLPELDSSPPPPTTPVLGDCPLQQMGPPVPVKQLVEWTRAHLGDLDPDALQSALLKALKETFAKRKLKMDVRKGIARLTVGLHVEHQDGTTDE